MLFYPCVLDHLFFGPNPEDGKRGVDGRGKRAGENRGWEKDGPFWKEARIPKCLRVCVCVCVCVCVVCFGLVRAARLLVVSVYLRACACLFLGVSSILRSQGVQVCASLGLDLGA